jgi:4-hydroxy-2-oxoheptanedioate aldolase
MRPNQVKSRLLAGEAVYGCFVRYPDPSLAEFLALGGWDFLMFDGEHGTLEPRDAENLVRACELRGTTPIIRVPTNQPATILRLLDTGAGGVHVPWINSGAEAEAAVRAVKYYPRGTRGLAGVRAADYGQGPPLGEYVRQANAETLVVVHIETAQAVERVQEIVAVEGVDVVFIGPTDLSHSLGVPGQPGHAAVQEAMQRIVDAVRPTDKALGILVQNESSARQWRERGARYLATTVEAVWAPAAGEYLRKVRGA